MSDSIVGYHFYGRYYADIVNHRVLRDGKALDEALTAREFAVLQNFLDHPRELLKREDFRLFQAFHAERHPVDDYVAKIRRKLGWKKDECILPVRDHGYRMDADVVPATASDAAAGSQLLKISLSQFYYHTVASMRTSLDQSLAALKLNPGLADAHIAVAYSYINLGLTGYAAELPRDVMPQARDAAHAALAVAPNFARAYGILGLLAMIYEFDWAAADASFRKALEFNRRESSTMLSYAHLLVVTGRSAEGLALIKSAADYAPTDKIIYASEGWLHTLSGDWATGIELGEITRERYREFPPAHIFLGLAYEAAGRYEDAEKCYARSFELESSPAAIAALGESVLVNFNGRNGAEPEGALTIDAVGNLYGTTSTGGENDSGTAFAYSASGCGCHGLGKPATYLLSWRRVK